MELGAVYLCGGTSVELIITFFSTLQLILPVERVRHRVMGQIIMAIVQLFTFTVKLLQFHLPGNKSDVIVFVFPFVF